jgi:hypothetical protein
MSRRLFDIAQSIASSERSQIGRACGAATCRAEEMTTQ